MGRGGPHQRTEADEAAFRQQVAELKARHNISDLVGRYTALKRAGPREMVGLCVFHQERTPSLRTNDDSGLFYCFGCGHSGDQVRFVQLKEGLSFMDALRFLGAANLPTVDDAERARRRETASAERKQAILDARSFFADAEAIEETQGAQYLAARGIVAPYPPTLRFARVPSWQDAETRRWGRRRPAIICGCQDTTGTFNGIQRIFVDGDRPDKAAVKLTLGRVRGSALRLGPVQSEIVVTEGPEDGLSLRQGLPGRSVWASCGTGLLPSIEFPPEVDSVLIAGQNNAAGRAAVTAAGDAYLARGLAVREMYPAAEFDDWNDELRGIAR